MGKGTFLHVCLSLFLLVVLGVALPTLTKAAINEQIPFYGTLQDTDGNNLSGTYDMVFRFYDAPTGGTLLDTSTHTAANGNAVTVTNGEFSALLGSGTGNTIDGVDFNSATIYIGLTIGSDSEMSPRERLAAAAYAFNTDLLDGYDVTELLRLNTTNTIVASAGTPLLTIRQDGLGDILNVLDGATEVFTILDGGNVGIGSSTPTSKLTVGGDLRLTGAFRDTSGDAGLSGQVLLSTLTGTNWTSTSSLGITASLANNSVTPNHVLTAGQTDEYCLTYESTGTTWEWQTCGGGASLFTDGGATTYLTALTDNLAIGTTTSTSSAKLTVVGNINIDGDYAIYTQGIRQLYANTASGTLALGYEAGLNDVSSNSYSNVLVGEYAGWQNSGNTNVVIGSFAGYSNSADLNTLIGYSAGENNSGNSNIISGTEAGFNNVGTLNLLVGDSSGYGNTGDGNILFGIRTGYANTGHSNITLGVDAGYSNAGDENIMLGDSSGENNRGEFNIMLGSFAGADNIGTSTVMIGGAAGGINAGEFNVLLGYSAGYTIDGDYNNALGYDAGGSSTGGHNNFIGRMAGYNNSGQYNNSFGYWAGYDNTGQYNNVIGYEAGRFNRGDYNNFIGYQAGNDESDGDFNDFIGYQAGLYLNSTSTVALGGLAIRGGVTTAVNVLNTVALGYRAGYNIRSGADNNIFLGYQAGDNITTGDNNIIIGYDIDHVTATLNNALNIGNLIFGTGLDGTSATVSTGNIGIGTSTPAGRLSASVSNTSASAGVLFGNYTNVSDTGVVTTGTDTTYGDRIALTRTGATGGTLNNYGQYTSLTGTFASGSGTLNNYGQYITVTGSSAGTSLNTGLYVTVASADTNYAAAFMGGNVGIGTSTPTAQLHTTGTLRFSNFGAGTLQTDASGNVSVSSDERLKDVVADYTSGLDAINGLQPIIYKWNERSGLETKNEYLGFSAQNVKDFIPEAVGEDSQGLFTLSDRGILAAAINAIKELYDRVTGIEAKVEEIDDLKRRIERLEAEANIDYEPPAPAPEAEPGVSSEPATESEPIIETESVPEPESITEPEPEQVSAEPSL